MGTFVTITVYEKTKNQADSQAIQDAFQRIHEIEKKTSYFIENNEIWQVNAFAGKRGVPVDSDLVHLARESAKISRWTFGAFDVTVGPLRRLWNFDSTRTTLPDSGAIASLLPLVDFRHFVLRGNSLYLAHPGMQVDLGGIAKGYAVDEAMKVLQKNGVTDAMVDAGGDFRTISSALTRGKRKVWIRHPRKPQGFFGWFPMDSGCVATSGDYEQYFVIDGVRYHHILDPKTGWPARKCVSVTIQAPTTMEADALATGIFALGPEKGLQVIESHPGIEGVIIFKKNPLELGYLVSSGLKKKLTVVDTTIGEKTK
jgi:thiamine biosynthesis lipoprotein